MSRLSMLVMLLALPFIVGYSVLRYLWAVAFKPSRAMLILVAYDQLTNALLNGDPDETISSRAAKARLAGQTWGKVTCSCLDAVDPDHCSKSIEYDRGRRVQ